MLNAKYKKLQDSNLERFFIRHMTFSVMVLGVFAIILYSLFNLLMYGPLGQDILKFCLKVIIIVILFFIIKLLLDMFDNKEIIDLRDLK